jgi:hypothetical protein
MPVKYVFLFILLCFSVSVFSQQSTELLNFNQQRLQTNKIGMITLGSWALLNISSGAIAARQAVGSNKYFHQMNAYWNVVNLALAGFGYYGSATADPASFTVFSSIKEQYGMEKILLFNAGLDAAYMATGLYLRERAKNSTAQADRLKGFGQSILLQGGFLLLFDAALYFIHHIHVKDLKNIVDKVAVSNNSIGLVFYF